MKYFTHNMEGTIVVADDIRVKQTVKDSVLRIYLGILNICFNCIRHSIQKIQMSEKKT